MEHPLLPMRLFRSRALTIGAVITALNFFVMLGVIFFVMLYLQNVRGFTPVEAGVRTLPLSLASLVASPLGAALTQRFGPRLTMPVGMLLQAASCFGMLTWQTDSAYATMWPPFIALGLGVGMVMSASSDAIVGNAPVRDGGVAGGLQATTLQIGGALGTSVLVSLIEVGAKVGSTLTGELTGAGVPPAVAHGLQGGRGRRGDGRGARLRRHAGRAAGRRGGGQRAGVHERRPHGRGRHGRPLRARRGRRRGRAQASPAAARRKHRDPAEVASLGRRETRRSPKGWRPGRSGAGTDGP
ncbi:hypothetical protein STENM327S_04786 [Streptomyces tendae]